MFRLRETACQFGSRRKRLVTFALTVIALLPFFLDSGKIVWAQSVQAPSREQADLATVQGSVRDSKGRPVAAATVHLQNQTETQTLTTLTDSQGNYRFTAVGEGVYMLRVEMAGYGEAIFGPCALGKSDVKKIDLTLGPVTPSAQQNGSGKTWEAEKPQFFDEPAFTVAGITEAANPGGHGSNMISRTTEALAKETSSLSSNAASKELRGSGADAASSASRATAEETLRKASEHDPENFEVNRQLGKLLVEEGKVGEALPYIERASQLNSGDYENGYELALAYANAGRYDRARTETQTLLAQQDKSAQQQAALHHLLADVDEKLGNPLEAVREYQRAAELDPSEPNLFDWGADLLLHRAYEPAVEVFGKGIRLFPQSARMLAGLGVAWYARGAYDQATQSLCEASDLNPDDPSFYLLLGKMQSVEAGKSECVAQSLQRFARLRPENVLANYYYALSLWNLQGNATSADNLASVQSLLEKTIHLDPNFGAGYLKLGILYSDRGDSTKALAAYQKAAAASPELEEAHYRLAQAYNRAGEKSEAQGELQLYKQLSKKKEEEAGRDRREIPQFVYTLRGQ
jgi:tetratricopeptide (TPR) repeat protein